MRLDGDGGSGLELKAVLIEVDRFVTCIATVIVSLVAAETGEAVIEASRERFIQEGEAPVIVKPFWLVTVTVEKPSEESEISASGRTPMLKRRLSKGSIRLEVDPLEHEPPL
jgi:hypothetical protein